MASTRRSQLILIVDDYEDIRKLLASYLCRKGYDVLEAANGAEAVQKATTAYPNFILLDLFLPDINGLEVARTLCKGALTQHIPIVGWTVDCREELYREALSAGYIKHCLEKPVSVSVIEALIERYANR